MSGASQVLVAVALLVAFLVCAAIALRSPRTELWWTLATVALTADTLVVQRARVLTIPLFFVVIIILLFWSARRAAERADAEEDER